MSPPLALSILGSTGSIGRQALDVARWRSHRVVGLAAGRNLDLLVEQALEFRPSIVSVHRSLLRKVRDALPGTRVTDNPSEVATEPADVVLGAIPGLAGLDPTRAALEAGRHMALANKEAMVVAGPLMWTTARSAGARIAPVDSELSAIYQCLVGERLDDVAELVLTASGGPFLTGPDDLQDVTPQMALKHPRWDMGPKITVDSSTLMNKGLEVMEASFLFELPIDRVSVVVHPQSIVHSLVRFRDGQLKAQLGRTDMRLAIGYGIDAALDPSPARPPNPLEPLALTGKLEFLEPDYRRFPCLDLAMAAGRAGGVAPVVLNAADEVAVEAFLAGRLSFTGIPRLIERVLQAVPPAQLGWDSIRQADELARALAREAIGHEVK